MHRLLGRNEALHTKNNQLRKNAFRDMGPEKVHCGLAIQQQGTDR